MLNSSRLSDAFAGGKQTSIASDNGLLPVRHQAIVWSNIGLLLKGPLGTSFSACKRMNFKMTSAKWQPFSQSLNVLTLDALKCAIEKQIYLQFALFMLFCNELYTFDYIMCITFVWSWCRLVFSISVNKSLVYPCVRILSDYHDSLGPLTFGDWRSM